MSTTKPLVITRVLPASPAQVFAAWTQAEQLKHWFCPTAEMTVPVAEVEPRDGGSYRIVMQNEDGETYSPSGTYESVVPNERLVFTFKWADSELVTRVTVELTALGDNETELTLTHEGFPETGIRDQHKEGWTGSLALLEKHLR